MGGSCLPKNVSASAPSIKLRSASPQEGSSRGSDVRPGKVASKGQQSFMEATTQGPSTSGSKNDGGARGIER